MMIKIDRLSIERKKGRNKIECYKVHVPANEHKNNLQDNLQESSMKIYKPRLKKSIETPES